MMKVTFRGDSPPVKPEVSDRWELNDGSTYVWDGARWVTVWS